MVTNETFENLKDLQTILVEKYSLESKVSSAPKQLEVQESALARSKKEYIAVNTEYEEVKAKVASIELELDEAIKSREAGEKGMDNITTHREYEALEKQINEAKTREDEYRKEKSREEKALAELKENLKNKEEDIEFQEKDLAASKESLDKEINAYKEKLTELKAEEDKITPKLDQEILFKFERIIQRNAEGIVSVKNGVCSGCHMILPAQFANIVRTGENINFCPYCSRILFYEEVAEEEEETYFDFSSAGSLADLDDEYEESEEYEEGADDEASSYERDSYGSDDDYDRDLDSEDDENDELDDEPEDDELDEGDEE